MYNIYFLENALNQKHRLELEQVFYFNVNQKRHARSIEEMVAIYGNPYIKENNGFINLHFSKNNKTFTLYALDSQTQDAELLGVLVYTFEGIECRIVHIAVHRECCLNGVFSSQLITFRLFEKLRTILVEKYLLTLTFPQGAKKLYQAPIKVYGK